MALVHSSGLKNYCLDSGFATAFDTDGRINIYQGTKPANADDALSGQTLLATLSLSADAFGAAASGALTAAAITSDTSADATGTAQWWRMYKAADSPSSSSTTLRRLDGTCGTSGADLNLNTTAVSAGVTVAITSLVYTHPA